MQKSLCNVHVLLGICNQNSSTVIYEKCCSHHSICIFILLCHQILRPTHKICHDISTHPTCLCKYILIAIYNDSWNHINAICFNFISYILTNDKCLLRMGCSIAPYPISSATLPLPFRQL